MKKNSTIPLYVSIRGTQKDSLVVEAEWPGRVARIPSGENGFGYDPLFIPEGKKQTAAELSSEEKQDQSSGSSNEKLSAEWKQWLEGEIDAVFSSK